MNKYELIDLQLHKEKLDTNAEVYYLSAVYRHETDSGVYEFTVPRIVLPISDDPILKRSTPGRTRYTWAYDSIDLGFGDLFLHPDEDGHIFYEKFIKEKIHDMTLDEIEKKLGYKVRVVSEK